MSFRPEHLQRELERVLEECLTDPRVEREFLASWEEFCPHEQKLDLARQARHREWFLLERSSQALEGVPIEQALARADLGPVSQDLRAVLRESFVAILEITSILPGVCLWARDLLGGGEYPLAEIESTQALQVGDVLVGRLYGPGESLRYPSAAARAFRSLDLLTALRRDAAAAHAQHRGCVRLSQVELERAFFAEPASQAQSVDRARAVLARGGLNEAQTERILRRLAQAAFDRKEPLLSAHPTLRAILDQLAFESQVDVEEARGALLAAWPALASPTPPASSAPRERRGTLTPEQAIAAFDRGRAEGVSLEQLFRTLEEDLGLDPDEPEEVEGSGEGEPAGRPAPDFPGVVGAMVEEYLWDLERERGPEASRAQRILQEFARFAQPIGVFENLSARDILVFCGVWLWEWGELEDPAAVERLLTALREFLSWVAVNHQLELEGVLDAELAGIESEAPRVWRANRMRAPSPEPTSGRLLLVRECGASMARLEHGQESWEAQLDPRLLAELRAGDRVRAEQDAEGLWRVYCVYPAQCAALERR